MGGYKNLLSLFPHPPLWVWGFHSVLIHVLTGPEIYTKSLPSSTFFTPIKCGEWKGRGRGTVLPSPDRPKEGERGIPPPPSCTQIPRGASLSPQRKKKKRKGEGGEKDGPCAPPPLPPESDRNWNRRGWALPLGKDFEF